MLCEKREKFLGWEIYGSFVAVIYEVCQWTLKLYQKRIELSLNHKNWAFCVSAFFSFTPLHFLQTQAQASAGIKRHSIWHAAIKHLHSRRKRRTLSYTSWIESIYWWTGIKKFPYNTNHVEPLSMVKFIFANERRFFSPSNECVWSFSASLDVVLVCKIFVVVLVNMKRILRVWTWAQELYRFVEMPHKKTARATNRRGKSDELVKFNCINRRFFHSRLPQALMTHKNVKKTQASFYLVLLYIKFYFIFHPQCSDNKWKKNENPSARQTVWLCTT